MAWNRREYQTIPQFEYEREDVPDHRPSDKPRKLAILGATVLGLFGLLAATGRLWQEKQPSPQTQGLWTLAKDDTLKLDVYNPNYGPLEALYLLPWSNIAEPYRDNFMRILSVDGHAVDTLDSDSIVWIMDGEPISRLAGSTSGLYHFDGLGSHTLLVKATTLSGSDVSGTTSIRVKYVRREVRALTETDREEMFDVMKTVYTVSTTEGQKLYGSKYQHIDDFVKLHLLGAGTKECDHWHANAAIMTHHVGFTLEFEQAMQAVNPAVTLAYWEYSMDAELTDYTKSIIFEPDWYGELNPSNEDHTMSKGPWSYIKVSTDPKYQEGDTSTWGSAENPLVNGFGQLRAPWNNNPSPYVGRHNTTNGVVEFSIPGCSELSACYAKTTLAEMNECLNGDTHGPVHILIGGTWDREDDFDALTPDTIATWKANAPLYFKMLWRTGFTRCPTSCGFANPDACKCSIPDAILKKFTAKEILKAAYLETYLAFDEITEEQALEYLRSVEDASPVGDTYTSAAPYDPTFWPLHGAADRLLGRKRILASLNEVSFDETWGFYEKVSPYLHGMCDWSNVDAIDELPECDEDASCYGHDAEDVLPFGDLVGTGDLTNQEMYNLMHPWNEDLPYIYDSYEFTFCTNKGYSF